ncbi:MAG: hypothetical protein EA384_03540 [Spirochaetaceae bacterium]|nr:MAG: hypothetical protein EA384_03540 [Spirochaetaceae bacterium]
MKRIAALLLVVSVALIAAMADEPGGSVRGVVPLPVVGYSPEDGLILGGAALFFRVPQPGAPTDTVSTNLIYGTAGTFAFNIVTDHRVGDGLILQTEARAARSVGEFYGVGMHADNKEQFVQLKLESGASLLFPVRPRVAVGPSYQLSYLNILETDSDGTLATGEVRGSDYIVATGPGARAVYDSRDSNIYPTRGAYVDLDVRGYPLWLGASDTFWRSLLDARYFVSLAPSLILGGQTVLLLSGGDVPFQVLPTVGGGYRLRGILDGRYRDNVAFSTQVELRYPILWRFSGTAFLGAGRVAAGLDRLAPDELAVAGGLGLRFAVDRDQRLNIRVDMAHDGEELSMYVNFQEAF